jgi:predicted ester cyclase
MSEDNKAWFRKSQDEIWNKGNLDAAGEIFAADVVIHNAAPGNPGGLEGVKFTVSGIRAAFPDLQFAMEDLIAEGDKIAHRWSITGTQKGEWMGAPPTGKKTTMSGISMLRIANGKIVEIWSAMTPST